MYVNIYQYSTFNLKEKMRTINRHVYRFRRYGLVINGCYL